MEIDVVRQIGAIRRGVEERERDGKRVYAVVATRQFRTTREDTWDAITNPARLPRWFLPLTGDLRPGGHYQLQGNAGGTIERCEPPSHLAVTWEFQGGMSWVEVRLSEEAGGTKVELEHIVPDDDHWRRYGPGATGVGWELALVGLDMHLGGAPPVDPEEAATWSMSEAGRSFVRASSDGWRDAFLAAGAPESTAGEMAANTSAFYTGEGG